MILGVRERGGHILGRLPAYVKPKYLFLLADGSYLAYFEMVASDRREHLYERLLGDLVQELLPERRHHINPRVVKRKMSNFHLKRPQHYHQPQPTRPFCRVIRLDGFTYYDLKTNSLHMNSSAVFVTAEGIAPLEYHCR